MAARFSRLFDEWDTDHDISMVDMSENGSSHQRASIGPEHDLSILSRDQTQQTQQNLPSYDDQSTRLLLRKTSATTTNDYESTERAGGAALEVSRPRQRNGNGMAANVKRLFHQKSLLSTRTNSTFDGNFAHGRPGWWHKQMLVDRSLRSMAVFTALCAVITLIILFSYIPAFSRRINKHSTSVGGKDGESCHTAEGRNVAVHLFINIAATMILGCSNTYQQLVTSLKVDEIRWVLSKRGDSKVGTNSPWAINHKKTGKLKAWLCWGLLILTSLPVHFLANSVIGPSFYVNAPTAITYNEVDSLPGAASGSSYYSVDTSTSFDPACWSAFRAKNYAFPEDPNDMAIAYHAMVLGNSTTYSTVEVQYTSNCTAYKNNVDVKTALTEFSPDYYNPRYYVADCFLGTSVVCVLGDPQEKHCRMNVRMQAAFILAGSLVIKAIYMIIVNYQSRFQTKQHCLTFGDVVVASVLDPDLKIKNECMLNSGDGYRHKVSHTCHKHCKDPVPSTSGDTIGHCQKCKKFNVIDQAADLQHPSIAIKYKRSLLSNLGSTAITQMITLMLTSLAMLSASMFLIVSMASSRNEFNKKCRESLIWYQDECDRGLARYLKDTYGTWGGFSVSPPPTLAPLPADSLSSEFMAFAISNGAQFLYSLLYLLLIYNLSLVSMEHEWGKWELERRRPRCTLVSGRPFEQSYFLQLPPRLIFPLMTFAALMHWLLGQAISTVETIFTDPANEVEHSIYFVTYAAYPIFLSTVLMIAMTVVCWWAFTYTREGFIPQMYGSIRTCCASTTELEDFAPEGILWGDLGMGEKFRHAGFSSDEPGQIIPAELYCGRDK